MIPSVRTRDDDPTNIRYAVPNIESLDSEHESGAVEKFIGDAVMAIFGDKHLAISAREVVQALNQARQCSISSWMVPTICVGSTTPSASASV